MEKSSTGIIKIAIVGPESTGKSTLAQSLADYYNEPWAPEVARNYVANLNRPYQLDDIVKIAEMQLKAEEKATENAKKMIFCDTTLLVNKIWASFVFKKVPHKILDLYHPQNYAIHLLCNIDLPWENDPLREHPFHRQELLDNYENDLKQSNSNYYLISGMANERFQNAMNAIRNRIQLL